MVTIMKLVVFSDSHGYTKKLETAASMHTDADLFVFLGDGIRDAERVFERFGGIPSTIVKGNCDSLFSASHLSECTLDLAEARVMCTHGHLYGVKSGLGALCNAAKQKNAALALYGHTHTPLETRTDGIVMFNPGSVAQGSYGIVYIEKSGVLCSHGKI